MEGRGGQACFRGSRTDPSWASRGRRGNGFNRRDTPSWLRRHSVTLHGPKVRVVWVISRVTLPEPPGREGRGSLAQARAGLARHPQGRGRDGMGSPRQGAPLRLRKPAPPGRAQRQNTRGLVVTWPQFCWSTRRREEWSERGKRNCRQTDRGMRSKLGTRAFVSVECELTWTRVLLEMSDDEARNYSHEPPQTHQCNIAPQSKHRKHYTRAHTLVSLQTDILRGALSLQFPFASRLLCRV